MASRFWVGGTGTWDAATTTHWSATSGGSAGASVPGAGDTVTLDANSGGGTITVNTNLTVTSITMGAFAGTLDFSANNNSPTMSSFSNSGTGARTLNMGSGTWTITGNNATVWTQSTSTNLTFNSGTSAISFTYAGGAGTRTAGFGTGLTYGNISVSAGSDTFTLTGSPIFTGNFSTSGFTGIFTKTTATITVGGNFTLGLGSTWSTTSGTLTLNATGSCTITTNGVNFNQSLSINGIGGTFTLSGNFDMTGSVAATLTLVNGTFNANNFNISAPLFNSSNSNTRTLTMGSGTWYITGNAATIWNIGTVTGLTLNAGTSTLNLNYSGSTGTRTFIAGGLTYNNFSVSAGSDTFSATGVLTLTGDFSTVGFIGTYNKGGGSVTCAGNFTLGTGSVISSTGGTITLNSIGSVNINTNGVNINVNLSINGSGGTFTLQNNLDISGTVNASLSLIAGTFTANGHNLKAGLFSITGTSVRTLNMGSGTWTATGSSTPWSVATTNLTLNSNTSSIILTGTGVVFNGATFAYYNVTFTGGGSSTLGGSGSFNNVSYIGTGSTDAFLCSQVLISGTFTVTGFSSTSPTAVQTNSAGTLKSITFSSANLINCTWTDISLILNGSGTTWTLLESLNLTSSTNIPILSIVQGAFTTNNYSVTSGIFASLGSLTRTINMGSSRCTLIGTGNVINFSSSGLTFNAGTSSFICNNASSANISIVPANKTFNDISFNRGSSTGSISINGNMTCNGFADTGTAAHTIAVALGNTITINSSWNVTGSPGNLITLTDTVPATNSFGLVNASNSPFTSDYLNIQNCIATPSNYWLAGLNSVNNQNVASRGSGWAFITQAIIQGSFFSCM